MLSVCYNKRENKYREVKQLVRVHRAGKGWTTDARPGICDVNPHSFQFTERKEGTIYWEHSLSPP